MSMQKEKDIASRQSKKSIEKKKVQNPVLFASVFCKKNPDMKI